MAVKSDLVDRMSKPGDIFYPFEGSYKTARAFMLLQLHRQCVVF